MENFYVRIDLEMKHVRIRESLLDIEKLFLIIILGVSLFINLYKIDTLMMFIGDMGRDYLAAYEMLKTGIIPLVGIQSSVVWLHQGPLSIYFIGLIFLIYMDMN